MLHSLPPADHPGKNTDDNQQQGRPQEKRQLRDGQQLPKGQIKKPDNSKHEYLLDSGGGVEPRPLLSRSAPGGVTQGDEDTDADGQKPGGDAQREQGITGHEVPALPHKLYDSIHSGHYGGHPGGHGLSMKPFLLSQKVMVAGPGIEPGAPESHSGVLPMH